MDACPDGADLYHEVIGEGLPMLVMHGGLGLDHTYFRPWLDGLRDTARLLFYDHRGNGRSPAPADWDAVDGETWARDADGMRQVLNAERVVVMGHSYGGFLALEYAVRYPDRVAGLILSNTAAVMDYPDVALANAVARARGGEIEALTQALSAPAADDCTVRAWWRAIMPLYFHRPDEHLMNEVAARIQYRAGAWNRSLALMPSLDFRRHLPEVRQPTLVLIGQDDWLMPPREAGERLVDGLPNGRSVTFAGSGHFPWMEEPDTFIAEVRAWLRGLTLSQDGAGGIL
jgi:proline iminopeptidase